MRDYMHSFDDSESDVDTLEQRIVDQMEDMATDIQEISEAFNDITASVSNCVISAKEVTVDLWQVVTCLVDYCDFNEWYRAYKEDRELIQAQLVFSTVLTPGSSPTVDFDSRHYNVTDTDLPIETLMRGKYMVKLTYANTKNPDETYEKFDTRLAMFGMDHLSQYNSDKVRGNLALDSSESKLISQAAYSCTVGYRLNRSTNPADINARLLQCLNAMPLNPMNHYRLMDVNECNFIMEDTVEFLSMHLHNTPWPPTRANPLK
jgi:hypothetical protein